MHDVTMEVITNFLNRRLVGLLVAVKDTCHHDTRKRQWRLTARGLHNMLLFSCTTYHKYS